MHVKVSSTHDFVQDISDMLKRGITPKIYFTLFETAENIAVLKTALNVLHLPVSGVLSDDSLLKIRSVEQHGKIGETVRSCGYPVVSLADISKEDNAVILGLNDPGSFHLMIGFFEEHQINCFLFHYYELKNSVVLIRSRGERELISAPDHAEENKEILREKLLTRPVVLFGGGQAAKLFYQKYHKRLNIRCVLTEQINVSDEKEFKLDDGTVIKAEPYNKSKIHSGDYIVVCRWGWGDFYKSAHDVLKRDGFVHMKDYIRSYHAEAILDGKKLWVWLGYCQQQFTSEALGRLGGISKDYSLYHMRIGNHTAKEAYLYQDSQDILKICDLLTYVPVIISKGKVDFDYKEFLPRDAKTFSIPSIPFRGYYPYKDSDLIVVHKYTYDRSMHLPFSFCENFLDDLILKGLSDDEIYEKVMRDDFIDEAAIRKNLKLAYKNIELAESVTDIKLLDYIKENLTDHMLYIDGFHYTNDLYYEAARRVCKFMDLDVIDELDQQEQRDKETGRYCYDSTETPVLPCVAKVLGMDFVTDDTLWRVKFCEKGQYNVGKSEVRLMTRKEWIYNYLAYTRAQLTLRELWNLKNVK